MRKVTMQAVAVCVVLAGTMGVANALTRYLTNLNELVLDGSAGHTQFDNTICTWNPGDNLYIGTQNYGAPADSYDGMLKIISGGSAETVELRIGTSWGYYAGSANNGRVIVDGTGKLTTTGRLAVGWQTASINAATGEPAVEPPSLLEITDGG